MINKDIYTNIYVQCAFLSFRMLRVHQTCNFHVHVQVPVSLLLKPLYFFLISQIVINVIVKTCVCPFTDTRLNVTY